MEDTIDYLHENVGREEWSGILVYTVDEGGIEDPDKMVITVQGMYLLDWGTSGYTEFTTGEKIIDVLDTFPSLEEDGNKWKMGKIHSHHNMDAFHSNTDMEDLHEHSETHAFYLSLVVNFDKTYDCKIGVHVKEDDRMLVHKDGRGGECKTKIVGKEYTMVIDCLIGMPEQCYDVPSHITTEFEAIKSKKAATKVTRYGGHSSVAYQTTMDDAFENSDARTRNEKFNEMQKQVEKSGFTVDEVRSFLVVWLDQNLKSENLLGIILSNIDEKWGKDSYEEKLFASFQTFAKDHFEALDKDLGGIYLQLAEACQDFLQGGTFDWVAPDVMKLSEILDEHIIASYNQAYDVAEW